VSSEHLAGGRRARTVRRNSAAEPVLTRVLGRTSVRYISFAFISFALDTTVLIFLRSFAHVEVGVAAVLANAVGFGANFALNRAFAFDGARAATVTPQFFQWVALFVLNLLMTGGIVQGLSLVWPYYTLSKVVATIVTQVVNYLIYRYWIFTPRRLEISVEEAPGG
jgi:putative flippase GtrA